MAGVADLTTTRAGHRAPISALVSIVLHGLLLVVFAVTSVRIVSEDRNVIPLVIRDPAPPPPPPGIPGPGPPAPIEVANETKFVDAPKPLEVPKPEEKPKIAAKPTAKKEPRRVPTPATSIPPTAAAVAAAPVPGGDAGS